MPLFVAVSSRLRTCRKHGGTFCLSALVCALGLSSFADGKAKYTSFDPSGSIATYPTSINGAGAVTGSYEDGNSVSHGFLRNADGTIVSIDPPESIGTFATSINDQGSIAGYFILSGDTYETPVSTS
jgi:hypothetical protein